MKRFSLAVALLGIVGLTVFWVVTAPKTTDPEFLAGLVPDTAKGGAVFTAGGCASCHSPADGSPDTELTLSGGRAFPSEFGTFYAPNISSDPEFGIGNWAAIDLYNAMHHGTSPQGNHYFPAFPYGSYSKASAEDIVSLHAYLMTLPSSSIESLAHEITFPFNIRRLLGGWKLLFFRDSWVIEAAPSPELERGRYLAEALAHCGECHTSRNSLGGLNTASWLGGAPNPVGKGNIPNITPQKLDWSDADLLEYFTSGFTPDFDTVGGHMVDVVENLAQLPVEDRQAIIAYLKAVPPVQ